MWWVDLGTVGAWERFSGDHEVEEFSMHNLVGFLTRMTDVGSSVLAGWEGVKANLSSLMLSK